MSTGWNAKSNLEAASSKWALGTDPLWGAAFPEQHTLVSSSSSAFSLHLHTGFAQTDTRGHREPHSMGSGSLPHRGWVFSANTTSLNKAIPTCPDIRVIIVNNVFKTLTTTTTTKKGQVSKWSRKKKREIKKRIKEKKKRIKRSFLLQRIEFFN